MTLKQVAEKTGLSISFFISGRTLTIFHYSNINSSFVYTNLSANLPNQIFEPIIATLLPGEKRAIPYSHKGQEFGYVLEGTLTIFLNDKEYILYPGDSIHLDSTNPHNWLNKTDDSVKVLWVISPPVFS